MTESKSEIRKRILTLRDNMSEADRKRGNLLLTERILGHQWFYRCESFLCFSSFGSEIATEELIKEAIRMKKHVFLPRVEINDSRMKMEFFRITSFEELSCGYRGIREPSGLSEKYLYSPFEAEKTLMLMPGVVFDKYRNRIGYGKGFYDRYLADKEVLQLHTIAVGYRCQLVDIELPTQGNDIRPYQVICV